MDTLNTRGTSQAVAGEVALVPYLPIPEDSGKAVPSSALRVHFSKLKTSASYDQVIPEAAHRSGAKPLTFSGDMSPNTVAISTPTVKITLNAQIIPQQPVCKPNVVCPLYRVLETVETKAILIELTNASVLGHKVSGEIVIGDAEAGE